MTIEKLRYFLAVCRCGSINRAAKQLYISQQGLSRSMDAIEKELGHPVFVKTTRGVEPTELGRELQKRAGAVVAAMEELEQFCQEYADSSFTFARCRPKGQSSMGAAVDVALKEYVAGSSHCSVVSTPEDDHTLLQALLDGGQADVVYTLFLENIENYDTFNIFSSEMKLILRRDHPLAAQGSVAIERLAGESFVLPPQTNGMSRRIEDVCRRWGFTPRVSHRAEFSKLLVHTISGVGGVTFLPELSAEAACGLYGNLVRLDVTPAFTLDYCLATRKGRSQEPAIRDFIQRMTECARREFKFYGI